MTVPLIDGAILARAREWVRLLASGDADAADIAALKDWLGERPEHARAFERERGFWQDLEPHRSLFAPRAIPATRAHGRAPHRLRRPSRRFVAGAVAASLLLAVTGTDILLRLQADHVTDRGEVRSVRLSDRSTAMLDANSAIAVHYSNTERRIELLRGRAWFDVAHDDARPFRVAAGSGVIEDVGTAFEVTEGHTTQVAVSQGAVRLLGSDEPSAVTLTAGQRADLAGGIVSSLPAVLPGRIAAWRHGELLIDDMPLNQAIALAGRYRPGLTLVWADLSAKPHVSGAFRIAQADEAVIAMATNAGVNVAHLPGAMILY